MTTFTREVVFTDGPEHSIRISDRAEEKDSVITKLHLIGDFAKGNANLHFDLSGTNFSLSQTFPSLT